ncbi:hypothetical protein ANCCAN_09990 [Ancylostoma caninum]|uniref:7TM GPCR serpentine receptor class x (Srx) domain-containing protein n=1 Tax=Ancylostoma caninum TaxID=29170 RepID=A0A368GM46_ANCCA|nr:hypothetical protein ANCCAN_09990 [Ancylostoma caninum]
MFTPLVGGTLTFVICTLLTVLYIPVLFIFYRRSEFHSVLAYRMMFWIGVADVGQLIILSLSGILAMTQSSSFPFYINKASFLCNTSTVKDIFFSVLWLNIVRVMVCHAVFVNRHNSKSFRIYRVFLLLFYNIRPFKCQRVFFFDKFIEYPVLNLEKYQHLLGHCFQLVYAAAVLIFLVSWIVKLTPYSSYHFDPNLLKWTYHKDDVKRKKVMKCPEIVLTTQHFLMSLLFFFGFLYWEFIDTWLERTVIVNFFSTLIWVIIVGLNPVIYLTVNRSVGTEESYLIICTDRP